MIRQFGTAQWADDLNTYRATNEALADRYAAVRDSHQISVLVADGEQLSLGVTLDSHGKMPDVLLYFNEKNWLLLIESVTSHGPVDGKRHGELASLFANSTAGLVFVTAFPNRKLMGRYLGEIAWETEVWVADSPSHLIHFNGTRFLGPYGEAKSGCERWRVIPARSQLRLTQT